MTRICWWLVDKVSRLLEPAERDAVHGDVAESGETGRRALLDVLGLVIRRQTVLWKDWQPWLALITLVVPVGMLLSLISRRIADGSAIYIWLYANNWTLDYLTNVGVRHDLLRDSAEIGVGYLAVVCWAWTGGFLVGFLSRRTIAVNGPLFCLVLLLGALFGAPQFLRYLVISSQAARPYSPWSQRCSVFGSVLPRHLPIDSTNRLGSAAFALGNTTRFTTGEASETASNDFMGLCNCGCNRDGDPELGLVASTNLEQQPAFSPAPSSAAPTCARGTRWLHSRSRLLAALVPEKRSGSCLTTKDSARAEKVAKGALAYF